MPRPFRARRVGCRPASDYFKPRGIPMEALDEVNLTMDELESIRLADLECNYQEEAAKKMNISRQTFGNILNEAHRKIADSLLNGKAVRIEGGAVDMMEKHFICYDCKSKWSLPYGKGRPEECPECQSSNIHREAQARAGGSGRGKGICRRRSV